MGLQEQYCVVISKMDTFLYLYLTNPISLQTLGINTSAIEKGLHR